MKRIITICMLAMAILIGGGVADAKKTTRKKTTSSQTTKKTTASFSVKGHTYKLSQSQAGMTLVMKISFKSDGTGHVEMTLSGYGTSQSDGYDITWKQQGNKVYTTDKTPEKSRNEFTLTKDGQGLIGANGVAAQLIE